MERKDLLDCSREAYIKGGVTAFWPQPSGAEKAPLTRLFVGFLKRHSRILAFIKRRGCKQECTWDEASAAAAVEHRKRMEKLREGVLVREKSTTQDMAF